MVDEMHSGQTIGQLLSSQLKFSRRFIRQAKRSSRVLRNGQPALLKTVVHAGDTIHITLPSETTGVVPETMPLDIRYEDSEVLVVNKPPGMLSHPSARERSGTLLQGVAAYLANHHQIPHAVHRLDRDTSGLILYAKHSNAHHLLDRALRQGNVHRTYCAIVYWGTAFTPPEVDQWDVIDLPIGADPNHPARRCIRSDGQRAVTHYRVLALAGTAAVVQIVLETGRTHQIRVHFAAVGMPLAGDPAYGREAWQAAGEDPQADMLRSFPRQALHAVQLTWQHPVHQARVCVKAEPPCDMVHLWAEIGGDPAIWTRLLADDTAQPPVRLLSPQGSRPAGKDVE
ncbi:MAG: RluA family pseudouridine synthase [Alicyclobacillus sp.]|nr:RluA family pseudouridine synthase [Alicyclobacillus sp.]